MEETFSKAIGILKLARQKDVDVTLNGDRLQLKTPKGKFIDKDLLQELNANKKLLIDYLSNEKFRLTVVSNGSLRINAFNRELVQRIPLSFSQERLWFIDRLSGSLAYNLPTVLRLKGSLNRLALTRALQEVINRHEILRTVYEEENGEVWQRVKPAGSWQLDEFDGSLFQGDPEGLENYIRELTGQPFDLGKDDMLRAHLVRIDSEEHILVATMHHIASDASSMPVLVREVSALYGAFASGVERTLPPLDLQYADYAVWQRNHIQGSFLDEKVNYWKEKLADVIPLQLPADYTRRTDGSARGSMSFFEIDRELSQKAQALSQNHGATLYMTLLAVFKVLLYRYSGQEDICVGTSVAGRPQQELENLIGFFANTLALRDQVRGDMPFTTLLKEVKTTTLGAYDHQQVPFEKVVDAVVKERVAGISPLFQVMLVLNNTPDLPVLRLGELSLKAEGQEFNSTKFDLTFFIKESKSGIKGSVQYNTDLYSPERISRMIAHFRELLISAMANPETAIGKLEMLSAAEQETITGYGKSAAIYPKEATIAGLFEAQAAQHPERAAVVFAGETISYRELNERANQLARRLQGFGVKAGTLVPLYSGRGIDMLTGILGILKSGGAYVPIDTDYPEERVSYMLEDTGAMVAVSSAAYAEKLRSAAAGYLEVITTDNPDNETDATNPETNQSPDSLAYVIYTSGSTGKPKGVKISHGNIADYIYGLEERIKISENKSFALVSSIATDLGNTVLYGSLLTGGALHVFSKETTSHIEALHEYFSKHEIDCLKIVPSHWKVLTMDGEPLLPKKQLIFGGEALQGSVVEQIRNTGTSCKVINHYGPTETTIGKLLHETNPSQSYGQTVPIGKPFGNTRTYVLSKEMELCPVGIPGQLYIAGEGVARGYLNNEALSKEKFIQHPKTGERMYATGDKVQYQADGNIRFIGRVDDQVKIRGYRVEPGEVGCILEQSEAVSQAVVIAREDKQGNKHLTSYIVPRGTYDKEAIQAYLKAQLPDYMIPANLVELSELPLTANGKIDRRALPDPEVSRSHKGYMAPRNETEERLAQIWQEVLEVDKVGITDDFFELGGHSLLAVRLVSVIQKAFGMELPINDVFVYSTIAGLAAQLESANKTASPVLIPIRATGNKMPLYIVCGSGGTVLKFKDFVKLLDDEQPVYALQQPTESKHMEGIPSNAEAIAEMYVKEIIKQNPNGPYALSGHCFGGKLALEMATQLKALGKKVSLLALFDVYTQDVDDITPAAPNNYRDIPGVIQKAFSKILLKTHFEMFLLLKHPKQAFQYKIEKLKSKFKVQQTEPGEIEVEFTKVTRQFKIASRNYKMKYYEGDVLVFYAKDKHYFTDWNKGIMFKKIKISNEKKYSWKKYTKSVQIYEVEGEHSTIFYKENAAEFSRILQEHLDERLTSQRNVTKVVN